MSIKENLYEVTSNIENACKKCGRNPHDIMLLAVTKTRSPEEINEIIIEKFSFDNFARNYPDYWVGHWTAADEVNSTLYRPGLYAFWIPIDNYRHGLQGYCSHPHTWPLYCYFKLKE